MYELILQNISRHIQLTPEETNYFTSLLKQRTLKKKQFLLHAGDVWRFEGFVTSGCLRTYEIDQKGQEHIIQFAFEDWWTGDMASFVTGQPANYTIDALEDSTVLLIEKSLLEQLYVKVPQFERFFRIILQNAFVAMQRRISSNLLLSGEERYHDFQARYPQFEQRLPLKQIAAYLGITPESLSRIRGKSVKREA